MKGEWCIPTVVFQPATFIQVRSFDLDQVGSQVNQDLRVLRTHEHARQAQNFDAVKGCTARLKFGYEFNSASHSANNSQPQRAPAANPPIAPGSTKGRINDITTSTAPSQPEEEGLGAISSTCKHKLAALPATIPSAPHITLALALEGCTTSGTRR
jgi:hypothetical protein